jgi:hypothetical protein
MEVVMKTSVMATIATIFVLLFAIPAICAEIDGQWIGTINRADGSKLEVRYRFRAKGSTLIGLIETPLGGGPISGGKIDGNSIEFRLVTGNFTITNTGTLSGNEIRMTETYGTQQTRFVLTRVIRR